MKKLLILGGSHAEIPLIQSAQKKGFYVITTGNQEDGQGHKFSDRYVNCDFSDKEAILSLARTVKADAICSGCNDFALLSAAYAAEKLGLPGHDSYETSLILHHKDRYRKFAADNGMPTPQAYKSFSVEEACRYAGDIGYPVIVKPVDLTGGKGIKKCCDQAELISACSDAFCRTREDHIIIEKFIDGTNHGFSAFIKNKKVIFFFADNEHYYLNKYMVSGASTPADVPDSVPDMLCEYSETISQSLGLVDGILHIQYILSEDSIPYIIEVCRRAPGDLYIRFVELATGVPYPDMIVGAETGEGFMPCTRKEPDGYYTRHCIMGNRKGVIEDVVFSEEILQNIVESFLWWKEGDIIENELLYKAGIVFLKFSDKHEMAKKLSLINELIKIKVR
ncbi:MAG: ATP-grasp domain-containing protein [Ruminococcus sp.]|nr:ATP-grasp domain-containing protein [Ruminococcus sp.]